MFNTFFSSSASNSNKTNPSESNNSNTSNATYNLPIEESKLAQTWNLSLLESSFTVADDDRLERLELYLSEFDRQVYRKYIEDVLKTRGLRKSLNFLERLHTSVLRKARLALERSKVPSEEDAYFQEEYEGDQELRRYGMWSPEAKSLNLPSYRAAFVFLSRVPLDVIHEFLRIRLEQKPKQPSPLSVRQLMRELREGLRIACIHRERFAEHSSTAAACEGSSTTLFDKDVKEFDESLKSVFIVYLDYLQQWVLMVQHDSFHKNLVQNEWNFVKSIARKINNGTIIASRKFCQIAKIMVAQINKFFSDGSQEFRKIACNRYSVEPMEK
ncbi:mitogen-activated protein kinase kinase kinase 4-like isoform X2 [Nasonia vitripennis]|uniref:Mitogen-activated protein kinase kinase kinase N-terminal domain-containing protein n=1 Tax=Nasonia vitripennis TaxID=7425 RepID=A0A7M7T941_NASVI|nr:mitogen-activated protein kinase kinase kinase 4-like isoform X2 [Nasonia vitripennis]